MSTSNAFRVRPTRRRIVGVIASLAVAGGYALWPTTPVSAVDYSSTCTIPLAPGAELPATITVTATAPTTLEAGAEGQLTDLHIVIAAMIGSDPGAVLEAGTLTLADGTTIALGASAASPDGNTFTWDIASVPFTAGDPPSMDFIAQHLSFSQGLVGVECPIASSAAFATVEITAPPTTTASPTTSTPDPTDPGGEGPATSPPPAAGVPAPSPATPVAGNSTFTG